MKTAIIRLHLDYLKKSDYPLDERSDLLLQNITLSMRLPPQRRQGFEQGVVDYVIKNDKN